MLVDCTTGMETFKCRGWPWKSDGTLDAWMSMGKEESGMVGCTLKAWICIDNWVGAGTWILVGIWCVCGESD